MDFALSEEQTLLRNSVERLFADQYTFDARKRYAQEPGDSAGHCGATTPSSACSGCRLPKRMAD